MLISQYQYPNVYRHQLRTHPWHTHAEKCLRTEHVPSSYSELRYRVDGWVVLVLLLAGGLVHGGETGGGSAFQSACEVTGSGGVNVTRLLLGGLLGSSDNGAGDCWAATGNSGTS